MNTFIARQGDLLISQVTKLPEGLKPHSLTLLLGESTGHSHRMTSGNVFEGKDGALYIALNKKGQLVHEEHNTIDLPKGLYSVKRQKEYVSANMSKLVVD